MVSLISELSDFEDLFTFNPEHTHQLDPTDCTTPPILQVENMWKEPTTNQSFQTMKDHPEPQTPNKKYHTLENIKTLQSEQAVIWKALTPNKTYLNTLQSVNALQPEITTWKPETPSKTYYTLENVKISIPDQATSIENNSFVFNISNSDCTFNIGDGNKVESNPNPETLQVMGVEPIKFEVVLIPEVMTVEQQLLLEQQLRQHIQMLTQTYLLCSFVEDIKENADLALRYLVSMLS